MRRRAKFFDSKIYNVVLIPVVIILFAILVSHLFATLLTSTNIDNQIADYIVSSIESVIAAIAAGLVIYQLRMEKKERKKQGDIEEAQFILDYNQTFIQDQNMTEVESNLEMASLGNNELEITEKNRQYFINYLVYLEGMAPLILNEVLSLPSIDDLMAYRFFLAINTYKLQKDQIIDFAPFFKGCIKLYAKWTDYRGFDTLKKDSLFCGETPLDQWKDFGLYCGNEYIYVRRTKKTDNLKNVARILYSTDSFIYHAAFKTIKKAEQILPFLMRKDDSIFSVNNIWIATDNDIIYGAALVISEKTRNDYSYKEFKTELKEVRIPQNFEKVFREYFCREAKLHSVANELYIMAIAVEKPFRGKKIGTMLMKGILREYRGKNISLDVLKKILMP